MNYEQKTNQGCLACSLSYITKEYIDKSKELEILNHGFDYTKNDFISGQINYFKKFKFIRINEVGENYKYYENELIRVCPKNCTQKFESVNLKLIDNYLKENKEIIVYINNFELSKITHSPHFIVVKEKIGDTYMIYNPWDLECKSLPKKTLQKAISSLKNKLFYSPLIIFKE